MTRRTFVAFVLLVALAVNTACATRYGPRRPVLEPARQAEIVRKQAEALGPGTRVVVTFADGNMLHGILQDVSAQSLAIRSDTRAAGPGQAFQLRDIAWIEKQRMANWKKTLLWVGIGIGALLGGITAVCWEGCA
ncbi:MAG TPA: hypothetical protein VFO67_20695 [Gemmatimonadales bacterium]|nr:hypothetical protein [Gemmatimonadales bacterium]